VAQRNDRPVARRTEFGLQVRLPQVLIFDHLQNTRSRCDAGVTQMNGVGRKLGLRLLKNRLAHEIGKRANHTPLTGELPERSTETLDRSLSGENHATFAYVLQPFAPVSIAERDVISVHQVRKRIISCALPGI
jgi:hypothetical protein